MTDPVNRCLILGDPRLGGSLTDPDPLRPLMSGMQVVAICRVGDDLPDGRARSQHLRFTRRLQDVCDREGVRLMLAGDARSDPLVSAAAMALARSRVALISIAGLNREIEMPDAAESEEHFREWKRLASLLDRPGSEALRQRLTERGVLRAGVDRERPDEAARRIAEAVRDWHALPIRIRAAARGVAPDAAAILTATTTHGWLIDDAAPCIVNLAPTRAHPNGLAALIDRDHLRILSLHVAGPGGVSIGRVPLRAQPLQPSEMLDAPQRISTTTPRLEAPPAPAA